MLYLREGSSFVELPDIFSLSSSILLLVRSLVQLCKCLCSYLWHRVARYTAD